MTKFSTKLLFFDLPFFEIHAHEYDPLKDIIDFWNNYDLETCRNYMMSLSKEHDRSSGAIKQNHQADQIEGFLIAMTRLIIAYYVAHDKGLDFGKIVLLSLPNFESNKKSLEISKLIWEFFNRLSINSTNKL